MKKIVDLKPGSIVKIDIENQFQCFGRVLEEPLIAFYDLKSDITPPIDKILSSRVLFTLMVMNSSVRSGRWSIIGFSALEDSFRETTIFFKQDPITKDLCLYENAEEVPATHKECKDLERAAVWSPEHVEDRLRDHYLGVPNKWVESLKIK